MSDDKIRVSKLMSEQKICSRREADEFIKKGWVLIDGQPINQLGTKIYPNQKISLSKSAGHSLRQKATILLNKPVGLVSGQAEKGCLPAVILIIPENQLPDDRLKKPFSPKSLKGLAPAGRLDIDSYGLLILTQDGRLAKKIIGENSTIEKEYVVTVEGMITNNKIALLSKGLELDGKYLKKAVIKKIDHNKLDFILKEGRKRQIRRMCDAVDLKVTKLKRIRIGKIGLEKLPLGKWRYLKNNETF